MTEREKLQRQIICGSRNIVKDIRRLIRDQDYWNEHVRKPGEPIIDVGKLELLRICEHHELLIECAKRGDARLPDFAGELPDR